MSQKLTVFTFSTLNGPEDGGTKLIKLCDCVRDGDGKLLQNINNTACQCGIIEVKGNAIPLQALTGPEGSRRLRLPDFMTIVTLIR